MNKQILLITIFQSKSCINKPDISDEICDLVLSRLGIFNFNYKFGSIFNLFRYLVIINSIEGNPISQTN